MSAESRPRFFDDRSPYLDRYGWLLGLTMLAIVALALVDITGYSGKAVSSVASALTTILVGVTFLLALRASGLRRRWQTVADVLVGFIVVSLLVLIAIDVLASASLGNINDASHPVTLLVLAVLAPVVVIRRLLQHRTITRGTLLGAIAAFLLIPIAFCYVFLSVNAFQGTPFFGHEEPSTTFMYYSLAAISTIGSDLSPSTPFARLLGTSEAIVGQVYLVTFVAMLVGLRAQHWASGRRDAEAAEPEAGESAAYPVQARRSPD